jgi:alpha-amylase
MPDLCTGCPHVQDAIAKYLNYLYDIGVKGVRIDAAKHIQAEELQKIMDKINPELYRFVEIFGNSEEAIQPPPYFPMGQITEYTYGYKLGWKFAGKNLLRNDLATLGEP